VRNRASSSARGSLSSVLLASIVGDLGRVQRGRVRDASDRGHLSTVSTAQVLELDLRRTLVDFLLWIRGIAYVVMLWGERLLW